MLLGLSRRLGGEGYPPFRHNQRIALTREARHLARRAFLVCDIYWSGTEGRRSLDVECQSRLAHTSDDAALSDADRATALDLVGVDVVNVTYATEFARLLRAEPGQFAPAQRKGAFLQGGVLGAMFV